MTVVEKAVQWAINTANDNSHGYEWGGWGPGYDCGHLVISAWENAGIPVKSRGGATYTGNMPEAFISQGFKDVTRQVNLSTGDGILAGDVLVNRDSHAAMAVGPKRIVQARSNLDGIPGDSSGQEIREQNYYNFPWTHVLRPPAETSTAGSGSASPAPTPATSTVSGADTAAAPQQLCTAMLPVLRQGDKGVPVERLQTLLIGRGYYCGGRRYSGREQPDGDFGPATDVAVRDVQAAAKIKKDGVVGSDTWQTLIRT